MEQQLTIGVLLLGSVYVLAKTFSYLSNGNWRDALGVAAWWVAGFAIAACANASSLAAGKSFGFIVFGSLTATDLVLAGFALAAAANGGNDLKRMFDNNDTAARPSLFSKWFSSDPG